METALCPFCQSKSMIKKGRRITQQGWIQTYQCKSCMKLFRDVPLANTQYSPRIIYHALIYYHQGHTLQQTSTYINRRFKVRTGNSTVHSWVKRFSDLAPIAKARYRFQDYDEVVVSRFFEHENLSYEFIYHQYKLKAYAGKRFPGLVKYIQGFENGCPDEFFEVGQRCSQPKFKVDVDVQKKVNLACHMTAFAISAKRSNRERHSLVEQFMLYCDTATVATEVPVWYWEKSIDSGVTGHIDMIQIRGGNVVILDYKPGAARDKKAAQQLYHYAVALSFRARVPFDQLRCAWFDESVYFEYSPSKALASLIKWKQ